MLRNSSSSPFTKGLQHQWIFFFLRGSKIIPFRCKVLYYTYIPFSLHRNTHIQTVQTSLLLRYSFGNKQNRNTNVIMRSNKRRSGGKQRVVILQFFYFFFTLQLQMRFRSLELGPRSFLKLMSQAMNYKTTL